MAETADVEYITVTEACKILKTSRQTIYNYIQDGRLRGYRLSSNPKGRVRLNKADVLALLTPIIPTNGNYEPADGVFAVPDLRRARPAL